MWLLRGRRRRRRRRRARRALFGLRRCRRGARRRSVRVCTRSGTGGRARSPRRCPTTLERVASELRAGGTVATAIAGSRRRSGRSPATSPACESRVELGASLPDALAAWARERPVAGAGIGRGRARRRARASAAARPTRSTAWRRRCGTGSASPPKRTRCRRRRGTRRSSSGVGPLAYLGLLVRRRPARGRRAASARPAGRSASVVGLALEARGRVVDAPHPRARERRHDRARSRSAWGVARWRRRCSALDAPASRSTAARRGAMARAAPARAAPGARRIASCVARPADVVGRAGRRRARGGAGARRRRRRGTARRAAGRRRPRRRRGRRRAARRIQAVAVVSARGARPPSRPCSTASNGATALGASFDDALRERGRGARRRCGR